MRGREIAECVVIFVRTQIVAAIFHGIKGRLARGTAASAHAQEYAATPSFRNHTAGT
jgi:hypothetical protein